MTTLGARDQIFLDAIQGNATGAPLGFSTIASLSSAKGLHQGTLGAIPDGATRAIVQPETQDVRVRTDGTNPTGSVGILLSAGGLYEFGSDEIAAARFIQTAASASLNIDFRG